LLANPGNNNFSLPNPAVLDLHVVVSGAASGNGTFGLADFSSVRFQTNGGTLDLTRQLVGQPTSQNPFGTTDGCPLTGPLGGTGGDFNLFNSTASAPNGEWFFTLLANHGTADCMVLKSLAPPQLEIVPTLSRWGLVTLFALLASAATFAVRRRYQA